MTDNIRRLAIFAHWDKDSIVDDYVIHHLEKLREMCDIVFCSDCDIAPEELAKIGHLTVARIAGRHGEYDFGSYKRGLLHAIDTLDAYDELVFANDSCYGPFFPLSEMWRSMERKPCDFWGVFEHHHHTVDKWHIQSYFLVFKRRVFQSELFQSFIRNVRKEEDKEQVIINYEVGLSDELMRAGFRAASLCPRSKINLTHGQEAFDLMYDYGAPYLKKALLARNPLGAPLLIDRIHELQRRTPDSPAFGLMIANLKRTAGKDYRNLWFHRELCRGVFLHRWVFRYKEKPLRWISVLRVRILGLPLPYLPWKINFKRIRYELTS